MIGDEFMLAPNPQATTATWPIAGDAPDLLIIVNDQAEVISAQEALLHAYQQNLNAVQFPPPGTAATGVGNPTPGATTSVTVGSVVGPIVSSSQVLGTSNATPPTVLGQISGSTGGAGVYLFSAPVSLLASTNLQFVPPPAPSAWPIPQDAPTLDQIVQTQTAVIRVQTSLLQHYQDLLNQSQVAAPPTGP